VAFGFGILDYIVVSIVVIWTAYLLMHSPQRLLLWLPTFLTIDFFIPLLTQLTPGRIVPLMLGIWVLLSQKYKARVNCGLLISLFCAAVVLSAVYSVNADDAGLRPLFRVLHYFSLTFLFLFMLRVLQGDQQIQLALWGLFIAGLIHASHAFYQVVAFYAGLPFRGIVYSETSQTFHVVTTTGLRVNGFADEPKRLGYILFVGALAALYFAQCPSLAAVGAPFKTFQRLLLSRWFALGVASFCLGMSLLTYSGSYFLAGALVVLIQLLTLSGRTLTYVSIACVLGLLAIAAFPERFSQYQSTLTNFLEERNEELASGLGARKVYRQEFFAEEYSKDEPLSLVFGVGVGRYNRVLSDRFGAGAGYDEYGGVMPLNSQFYEVGLELGAAGLLLIYVGGMVLVLQIGRRNPLRYFVGTMLLFLLIESLFIDDKLLLDFVAAVGSTLIWRRATAQRPPARSTPCPLQPHDRRRGLVRREFSFAIPSLHLIGGRRAPIFGLAWRTTYKRP
jgi:hypothetical protein